MLSYANIVLNASQIYDQLEALDVTHVNGVVERLALCTELSRVQKNITHYIGNITEYLNEYELNLHLLFTHAIIIKTQIMAILHVLQSEKWEKVDVDINIRKFQF